ncbi:CopG family transcriptional regulator [Candidatus Woesearchaeota archaeon]|nr:CopG family transcriptional regulator [Candidatus Woesearchaeota archaeon]
MEAKSTIEIPKGLAERLKKRSVEAGFDSVNSYAAFVLEQVLGSVQKSGSREMASGSAEEELVRKRLRSLGYD